MNDVSTKTCNLCRGILRHPLFMIVPSAGGNSDSDSWNGHKLLVAARMKCTCRDGITVEHERNGADLNDMSGNVRRAILAGIRNNRGIPVIDPDHINESDHLILVVDFDKGMFRNWLALDLISVEMFDEHIRDRKISVEKVTIPR